MLRTNAFPKEIYSLIISLKKNRLISFHLLHPQNTDIHESRSMLFWNRFREKFGFLVAIASNFSFHPFRKPRGGGHVDADAPEP